MAARGDRDSRLNGARLVSSNSSVSGSFRLKDFDDLVRFNTTQRSSFNLDLSRIAKKNNVDVQLYRFLRPVQTVLKSIGKTDFRQLKAKDRRVNFQLVGQSTKPGNRAEKITIAELESGDYFIRFLRKQGNRTSYTAQIKTESIATPVPNTPSPNTPVPNTPSPNTPVPNTPSPNTPVPNTPSPNTPGPTPIPVIPLPSNSITGQLTNAESEKRYSIEVAAGDFQFNLTNLSADADIQLLSADANTVLRSSVNTGTNAERFIQPLDGGKYVLRVFRKAGNTANTSFAFNLIDLEDGIGNSEAAAQNLGVIGAPAGTPNATASPVNRINYAVSGGKESPVDYYRFRLPSRGFVRVDLTGKVADGSALFGNLDVDLYEAGQPNQNILSADSLGNAAEVFAGTLSGNADYIIRVRPQNGSAVGEGSTYNFRLTFSPRSDNPSIVRDIQVGTGSSDATNFTEVNGLAYFSAKANDGGVTKNVLWQSEGTLNRTARIFEFDGSAVLSNFTNVNGQLYFVAQTAETGAELWTSDGTRNGTKLVSDLAQGTRSSNPDGLTVVGNDLFFYTSELDNNSNRIRKLYRITQGSTTPVQITSTDLNAINPVFDELTNIDGTLYFSARDASGDTDLWRAITSGGGVALERMFLRPDGDDGVEPTDLINVGGKLFLTADVEIPSGKERSRELIRIDTFKTTAYAPANPGYTLYDLNTKDFDGLPLTSRPPMVYIEQTKTLYFVGNDPTKGTELHRLTFTTDTSQNGLTPQVVKDIRADAGNSSPSSLLQLGSRLVFLADDGAGQALWITNEAGDDAAKLSSLTGLSALSNLTGIQQLTVVNNTLFFVANDATNGQELRQVTLEGSSGTLSTFNLADGAVSSSPNSLAAIGGQLFFLANNGVNGSEPWSVLA